MSSSASAGCRVVVDSLFFSHTFTQSARRLVGNTGYVLWLITRGSSTYALVEMDDAVPGFPGQRRWTIHTADLTVISYPSRARAEPVFYVVGFENFPVVLKANRGIRHAVPGNRADRDITEAICGLDVRPVDSSGIGRIAFDSGSSLACSGCVANLSVRHPEGDPETGASAG
ncbi:hypothetical protein ABT352_04705 [Streptosporangium sp. NPDC000563]|uniref:hypothetical protein n=1 Tax=Streptosporangium sp. NPDC000563 TaxID=3154366 RepID=UPI0033190BD3